jgi:hypothetical protein
MTLSLSKDGTNVQKEAWVCGTESFGKLTGCFIADYTFASEPVISNPKFVSHPSALCHGGTGTFFFVGPVCFQARKCRSAGIKILALVRPVADWQCSWGFALQKDGGIR